MAVIALDLGGTKLAGAVFAGNGKLLHKTHSLLAGRHGRAVGELIRLEIRNLCAAARAKRAISAIGISIPGISDSKTGKVWAPNIAGWENYPLRKEIEQEVAIPGVIDSDRACSILGEAWKGAARGCTDAIFLAVGTGIGAGILVDGEVLRGSNDIAGAIGWLALERPFRSEYAGCGCLEYHASGAGLVKVTKQLLSHRTSSDPGGHSTTRIPQHATRLTAAEIFAAYERRDTVAKAVLRQAVEHWGMAVANLISLFNPQKIIFGGGLFGPARKFLDDICAEATKWAQPIAMKQVRLQVSKLGADAALYGAGRLALQATVEKFKSQTASCKKSTKSQKAATAASYCS